MSPLGARPVIAPFFSTETLFSWTPVLGAATEEGYHLNNYVDPDTTKDGTGVYDYANQGGGTGGGTTTTGIGSLPLSSLASWLLR